MATNRLIIDSNGRQFSADSMDRFGDDMTELIVSYLPFEDKTRLEGVAKQWQRLIYNRITSLLINGKDREFNRLLTVHNRPHCPLISIDTGDDCNRVKIFLKKCPNIRHISIVGVRHMPTLIQVMADNCQRLRSLSLYKCNITTETMTLLSQQLAPKLKELDLLDELSSDDKYEETLLELCPNVETLACNRFHSFSDRRSDFLPKLKSLETKINAKNVSLLADFSLKYGKQLKVLCLTADYCGENVLSSNQINEVFRCIPIFEEIIKLELNFWKSKEDHKMNIEKELIPNCIKCLKLKKLLIDFPYNAIEGNVWKSFANFTELNELKFLFWTQTPNTDQPIKDMGLKTNLKRLNVRSINEKMFEDIHQCVPNLKSIDIDILHQLSDALLKSLSALKHLKVLNWWQFTDDEAIVTDSGSQLLDNYPELKKIKFWRVSRRNITNKTIENIIAFANRRPKQVIEFQVKTAADNEIDMKQFVDSIPANLKISIF